MGCINTLNQTKTLNTQRTAEEEEGEKRSRKSRHSEGGEKKKKETMYVVAICVKFLLQACIDKVGEISQWLVKLIALAKFGISERRRESVKRNGEKSRERTTIPTSVNYHFTRQCNYKCGFCFHTAKTSFVLPLEEAQRGLKQLKAAGMEKINFSGGEPFLHNRGEFLGKLVQYCKQELKLPSVSVVSNGSRITEKWFKNYGKDLDILAVSCDSFEEDTNRLIGRGQGNKNHIENLLKVRQWCKDYKVAFKINSVINRFNLEEDMNEQIRILNPVRWKVFQCLLIEGENAGEEALRHAETFIISSKDFQRFLDRHEEIKCLVPESNEKMRDSYLILDEYMRFLDCTQGRKDPSKSILDVGVENAIKFSGFDEGMFFKRGGKYIWSKADMRLEW